MAIVSWRIALITVSKVPWSRESFGGRKTNYNHWIIQVKGNTVCVRLEEVGIGERDKWETHCKFRVF